MKLSTQPLPQPNIFKPFSLTITFETEEELGAFYSLFNHANICDITRPVLDNDLIREAIFNANKYTPDYWKYHQKLCNIIK